MTNSERIVLAFILSMASIIFPVMAIVIMNNDRYVHVEPFFTPDIDVVKQEEITIDPNDVLMSQSDNDIKNYVRDESDNRPISYDEYAPNTSSGDPYQRAKDYEQQLFNETGGEGERNKIKNEMNQRNSPNTSSKSDSKNPTKNNGASSNQYTGDVMVSFKLDGRSAYDNNMWYVRNPGYTCGYGSSGKVVVQIKVDQGGKVVDAQYLSAESSGANQCMIEQSVKYAKKSRFNYKESASSQQTGKITYKFIAQQ